MTVPFHSIFMDSETAKWPNVLRADKAKVLKTLCHFVSFDCSFSSTVQVVYSFDYK